MTQASAWFLTLVMTSLWTGAASAHTRDGFEWRTSARTTLCNTTQAAEDYWFTNTDPNTTTQWFETVTEAESYVDPFGRRVYWLVRETRTTKLDSFVGGINDLWAVKFNIGRTAPCTVEVTGEH